MVVYGVYTWGSAKITDTDQTRAFQSRVVRTVSDTPQYVTNEMEQPANFIRKVTEIVSTNILIH